MSANDPKANSTRSAEVIRGCGRDSSAHAAKIALASATPPATIAMRRQRPSWPMACAICVARRVANRPSSAAANAFAVSKRSAGSFSSAFATAAATVRHRLPQLVTGRAGSVMIFMMICCADAADVRRLAGEHLVQHGRQRVDVAARA